MAKRLSEKERKEKKKNKKPFVRTEAAKKRLAKYKKKITKSGKKALAKQIGKQVKKLIASELKIKNGDALGAAGKLAEIKVLDLLGAQKDLQPRKGVEVVIPTTDKKEKKFKIKFKGQKDILKDMAAGRDFKEAFKGNARIEIEYSIKF